MMSMRTALCVWSMMLASILPAAALAADGQVTEVVPGSGAEKHLPSDRFTQWSQDPELLANEAGDRLEELEVVGERPETVKLKNVVPPIHFDSGVADIPQSTIERLRVILEGMRHLDNVRLHVVGHADSQPLSDRLAGIYGDNAGLSRERSGEVAEFLQRALDLPPEAISFEWAGDRQPIASNATEGGRALNRRVEVEVWHDSVAPEVSTQEVVVPAEIKRVKICRTETVCLLRYREGNARRARVKNLVAPLHYDEETVGVPARFTTQIAQALRNLQNKHNVTVRFIGFSDDTPLTGRAERLFGTHLAMSKARARRVALAVQEALELPAGVVESDGRGETRPLASNDTERGRALNRRIEVEFWHDDPLQELPDDPQPCPDAGDAEWVTKVYDPPWGPIAPLAIEDGQPTIPPGYGDQLRRAMADIADRTNVRLRFVGYTGNDSLDRRTALVYGDDIGLSADRARRAMETIAAELELSEAQAEHEGRGYVHADDVVNAGFLQEKESYVVAEVVYDELAMLDDYEGVEITPITRELRPSNPLALNLMHITVDGEPLDDPARSSSDTQRCTDVALEQADIQFGFDTLTSDRRLSVTAQPYTVAVGPVPDEPSPGSPLVQFQMYTNYPHFIERAEVRIFVDGQSVQAEPLDVAEVGAEGIARWKPAVGRFDSPVDVLQYVLRAYDSEGHFDETTPQPLWLIPRHGQKQAPGTPPPSDELQAGYGESGPLIQNIPLGSTGSVHVQGRGIPPEHTVWFAGEPVAVDSNGSFVAEAILPDGMHTVEVAVLDPDGNGELFLRDLELRRNDWFYTGIADLTLSYNHINGPLDELSGENSRFDYDSWADGRLAFYLNGKFGDDWSLTASADTREDEIGDLFTNFLDKSRDSLLRRIDPDYHYPTFGDDSSVEETAPTSGKFYARLDKGPSHAMWGNFRVDYVDNELAQVERGLYGGNLHYETESTTRFGEKRARIDGFAADPGTVSSREEFRGTGGSLYFLRTQDILTGSERVRIEVRDKDSGLVTSVVNLRPVLDYDIDYLQGRILLSEPIGSTVDDDLLVRSQGLSGNETWLVIQYEHSPGFDKIDTLATGGQAHYWFNDFVKLGVTASRNDQDDADSSLYAADLTLRKSTESWLKLQVGHSEGLVSPTLRSDDGGFRFVGIGTPVDLSRADGNAYRADLKVALADLFESGLGQMSLYGQHLDAGYSAPNLNTLTDTEQFGGAFRIPVTEWLDVAGKADSVIQDQGLETHTQELDVDFALTNHWNLSTGVRNDYRHDDSPVVVPTQREGQRTDAVVEVAYDPNSRWRSYGFAQATLARTDDRKENRRVGIGGAYRLNDRMLLDGEVSYGDLGLAAKLGTRYQQSEGTERYLSYVLGDERAENGLNTRRGNLISGLRSRLSESASVYLEDRYQHSDATNGLTRAFGIKLVPTDRWNFGANWETGRLYDRQTYAETRRNAGGARIGYGFDRLQLASGIEYRFDEAEQLDGSWTDRTTWLIRNTLKFQMSPDWRLVGKFDYAHSDSSLGQFFDGGYTEAVLGYAFSPVANDRLHALAKYTYFYNVPTTDQVTLENSPVGFIQKSHIAAIDVTYDLTDWWSIGGKYAYRLGQVSLDRKNPKFFDNDAHLYVVRTDFRIRQVWEALVEARMLQLPDLDERRTGALIGVYRYLGDHFKVGVGYNFTDFSDDLTDLDYDHQGIFINLIGTL